MSKELPQPPREPAPWADPSELHNYEDELASYVDNRFNRPKNEEWTEEDTEALINNAGGD